VTKRVEAGTEGRKRERRSEGKEEGVVGEARKNSE